MRIRWTPPAAQDMQGISDYLKERHPQYRLPTMRKLYRKIQSLKQTPHLGRPGRIEGTREIVFTPLPYVAVYRVEDEIVEIWRIRHAAQERLNVVMEKNRLRPQVLAPF